ncbi:L-lactate MFS transporter [Changpingibacter yushuensis]|uniref:L-lactate MFS transporter n=1 Tax=Changpingibacter yushuensis TaxID=2758440 RepID=UPI00165E7E5A|nr:OFA family MFS transporter [Changpingibacter yushuensis]
MHQDIRVANRNYVFIGAFIAVWVVSAANVFTVFDKPLQEATGGSAAEVALALTIYQTVMALCGILSGRIVDQAGPRKLAFVGGAIFGLGWILTGFASSIPVLYFTYGVLAGAGNGLLYNPAINTALKWFPEKRGTMNGVLLCAASIGAMMLSKIGAVLNNSFGQKGFIYIGIGFLILSWTAGALMRPIPDGWQPKDWKASSTTVSSNNENNYGPKQMVSTTTFWLMLVIFAIAATSGLMLIGKLSAIVQTQLGFDAVTAANFVMINTAANLVGRLTTGKLCDKIGEVPTLAGILVLTITGLLGLSIATNPVVFAIFLCLLGASFGGVLVVFPPLTSRQFGMKNFGINYGIMFFAYAIASLVGPQIASNLVDTAAGVHAYQTAFYVASAVAVVGLALIALLHRVDTANRKKLAEAKKVN